MKKVLVCILLLLTCCIPLIQPVPTIDAFKTSDDCTNVCWLGINPGVTSAEQARVLLRASDQINQKEFHRSADGIETIWFTEKTKTFYSRTYINFRDGLVESIYLTLLAPFTMDDFVKLFGEPDEISIRVNIAADAEYVSYILYYTKKKAVIEVISGSDTGPAPADQIQTLILSTKFDTYSQKWLADQKWMADYDNYRQPWLGYGHFGDYLPGVATPMPNFHIP